MKKLTVWHNWWYKAAGALVGLGVGLGCLARLVVLWRAGAPGTGFMEILASNFFPLVFCVLGLYTGATLLVNLLTKGRIFWADEQGVYAKPHRAVNFVPWKDIRQIYFSDGMLYLEYRRMYEGDFVGGRTKVLGANYLLTKSVPGPAAVCEALAALRGAPLNTPPTAASPGGDASLMPRIVELLSGGDGQAVAAMRRCSQNPPAYYKSHPEKFAECDAALLKEFPVQICAEILPGLLAPRYLCETDWKTAFDPLEATACVQQLLDAKNAAVALEQPAQTDRNLFAVLDDRLQPQGWRVISLETGTDSYALCALPADDVEELEQLASKAGLTLAAGF